MMHTHWKPYPWVSLSCLLPHLVADITGESPKTGLPGTPDRFHSPSGGPRELARPHRQLSVSFLCLDSHPHLCLQPQWRGPPFFMGKVELVLTVLLSLYMSWSPITWSRCSSDLPLFSALLGCLSFSLTVSLLLNHACWHANRLYFFHLKKQTLGGCGR